MIDHAEAQKRAEHLISLARKAGADSADALATGSTSEGVGVRMGQLEDVERSEDESISLRVFVGQRSASVSAGDASLDAMRDITERAVAMAKLAPEDPYSGIAAADQIAHGPFADLDLYDDTAPSPQELRDYAIEIEEAGRAVAGITNSEGASAGSGRSVFALVTSNGFCGSYGATTFYYSASMIAGSGDKMQRDYEGRSVRHRQDLPERASVGLTAAERAVARLDPRHIASGSMPIVFDPRVGGSLIGHLLAAMNGSSAARRSTFLLDRINEAVLRPSLTLVEDPFMPRGLRSRPFDGEGLAVTRRKLVENGRVFGWMHNLASARQLGEAATGHGSRSGSGAPGISPANIYLENGELTPAQLMADIKLGIYVTELIGQGVNGVTGDYSRGASGFVIRDGAIAEPVSEFTIAGNLLSMFASLTAANDLEMLHAINVPTLRVDQMNVAGQG